MWGCLKCVVQKKWAFGVVLQARIALHQIRRKACSSIPSMGVFERRTFRRPNPRCPKPLLLADLMQRHARLGRHAKTPHFLALRISNTLILGIQKRFGGQMWCRGRRAWSATPNPHFLKKRFSRSGSYLRERSKHTYGYHIHTQGRRGATQGSRGTKHAYCYRMHTQRV